MPKRRKIPTPSWEHAETGTLTRRLDANRWQLFATGGVLLLVLAALGVVGYAFLSDWIEDRQRPGSTAIEVLDHKYTVRDFSERSQLYVDENGGQNSAFFVIPTVANDLIEEAVLLEFAEAEGATVTEEDIREEIALTLGITVDDPNFDARLQEELDASGLTEEEYTELNRARALKGALTLKFQDELPETIPSVNYRQIVVGDQDTADGIVSELEGGADFATLYMENSTTYSEEDETGGEQGFVPEGVLSEDLEAFLFGLEEGEIRTFPANNSVLIVELIESSAGEPPTEDQQQRLAANAYTEWFNEKRESLDIVNEMEIDGGDTEKITWVIEDAELVVG